MANKESSIRVERLTFSIIVYILLILFIIISIMPIFIMWFSAFRPSDEIVLNPFSMPERFTFQNIVDAWRIGKMGKYFINSIITIIPRVAGVLLFACLAGYGFAKLEFRGKNQLFYYILFGMMIPIQSIMIPMYYNMQKIGMINTYVALIIPAFGLSMPFGIFFMRAFFMDLPNELMDSARIDGAREFRIFWSIMLPLTIPALSTLLVFEFMWGWNDFLLPLLMIYDDSYRTLPLGLMYFKTKYTTNYSLVAAGVTISSLPIVVIYTVFQKSFIRGLTSGAVKG